MSNPSDKRLLVVHLSDMHLRKGHQNAILERVRPLVAAIAATERMHERKFLFLFSGDVAFAGTAAEYDMARGFFDDLKRELENHNIYDFFTFVIPGNHDCNFSNTNRTRDILIDQIYKGEEIDQSVIDICTKVQDEFFNFKDSIPHELDQVYENLQWVAHFDCFGKHIRINGYNTSWVSQKHEDYGQIYMPVELFKCEADKSDLIISTFHHPYSWLPVENRNKFREYIEDTSDFSFTGHEHYSENLDISSGGRVLQRYVIAGPLQENSNQSISEFNIAVFDLENKSYKAIHYSFKKGIYQPDEECETWIDYDHRSKRNQSTLTINDDYRRKIESGEFEFTTSGAALTSSDLFIFPNLREFVPQDQVRKIDPSLGRPENGIVKGKNFNNWFLSKKRIIVYGPDRSGKTTLARQIQLRTWELDYVPIIVDCHDINKYNDNTPDSLISASFKEQYGGSLLDVFMQLPPSKRIVLLDNFSSSGLNENAKNHLIHAIERFCEYTIVMSSDDLAIDSLSILKSIHSLKDYARVEIIPFGHSMRYELISKWYKPKNPLTADIQAIENRCIAVERIITSMIANELATPYPFQILIMLQYIEATIGSDVTSASYASFCEVQIKSDLNRVSHAYGLDQGTLHSILEDMSYRMYSEGVAFYSIEEFKRQLAIYSQDFLLPVEPSKIIDAARSVGILKVNHSQVQFVQGYQLYYFIASKINTMLQQSEDEAKNTIKLLCQKIHLNDSANIIIFLAFLSKSKVLVDIMLEHARELLSDATSCDFDATTKFAGSLINKIPQITLNLTDPTTNRILNFKARDGDEYDDETAEYYHDSQEFESDKEEIDKTLKDLIHINSVFKTIDVIGHILKVYPGTLHGDVKIALTKECYDLSMRGLGMMYELFEENLDSIVDFIRDLLIQESKPEDSDRKAKSLEVSTLEEKSKSFVFHVLVLLGHTFLTRLTNAIGAQKLSLVFDKLLIEAPVSYQLIDLSIRSNTFSRIEFKQVQSLASLTENKIIARMILVRIVVQFFYLYNVNRTHVQQICNELGISYRSALISSVKGEDQKRNLGKGILD